MKSSKKQANKGKFVPGDSRLNSNGRPKGSKNKVTSAWDSMAVVFEKLGGEDRMVGWVKENKLNERIFYTAFMSKAKTEIGLDVKGNIGVGPSYEAMRKAAAAVAKENG